MKKGLIHCDEYDNLATLHDTLPPGIPPHFLSHPLLYLLSASQLVFHQLNNFNSIMSLFERLMGAYKGAERVCMHWRRDKCVVRPAN